MATKTFIDSPAWEQFKAAARRRRRDPVDLLTEYMNECLEIWEDEILDEEVSAEAQRSGHAEEEAASLVQQYRREKRQRASS